MLQHKVRDKQFVILRILLGLALAVSALSARGQILPSPLPIPSRTPVFSSPQDVSRGTVVDYQMAVDSSGNVNFAWQNNSPGDVFFSRSSDRGQTFSAPVDLSNAQASGGAFQIAVDPSGTIYAAWYDFSANVISVVRSTDGGASFSELVQIATSPGPPSLTIDPSGAVFLCWTTSNVPRLISCSQSTDGGATFSPAVTVASLNRNFQAPLMAVDNAGNINLAWTDNFLIPNSDFAFIYDVFFSRSTDGGTTFSPPQKLSGDLLFPPTLTLALDPSGNINLLWNSILPGNVFFSRSNDGGATFTPTQVTNYPVGPSPHPESASMAIDSGGNINVVWFDDSAGNFAIFFSRSTDGGATFSPAQNISGATTANFIPGIATDARGNIDVVWNQRTPGTPSNTFISDIVFSRSTDGGTSFSTPLKISNSGESFAAAIALDSCGNINVAWTDDAPGTVDLFFTRGATSTKILNICIPVPLSVAAQRGVTAR